jgi:DHA1 family bicyclomycin/chloramphenicol resistance-like MFS transporter
VLSGFDLMRSKTSGVRLAVSLAMVTILGPSAIDMYLASMPQMATDLATTFPRVQLTLTVFLLALGLGQLVFGPVIDAFGRRLPLLGGITIFAITGVVAATAVSIEMLLYARFFQGLAASMTLVVAITTVRDVAEGALVSRRRP